MPVPIICLDEALSHFVQEYRRHVSKPQYQYFVTVLLGLLLCEGRRVLSILLRQVAVAPSLEVSAASSRERPGKPSKWLKRGSRGFESKCSPW